MLTIEIVSDIVCPWCFIGTRRLATALDQVRRDIPGFECRIVWRPFFLNPDTPPEGEPYMPFLEKKFGSRAEVEALFERVRTAGRAYGIEYAFEKIQLRANTLAAHRLLHWAQSAPNAEPDKIAALVERLFAAQFQRGEHVGDKNLLTAIAAECGYDGPTVAAYLASDRDADTVRRLESEFRQRGIGMVPTFVIDGTKIIVGAEDPAILAAALREAWQAR
jgi:predicted DsbA family dithiol-disulfide isomerase